MPTPQLPPERLFEVKLVFLRELSENYRKAREAQEQYIRNPHDPKALEELFRFFHRIAGIAHTVELPLLGYLAAICERVLEQAKTVGNEPQHVVQIVADGLAAMAWVLDQHGSGPTDRPLSTRPIDARGIVLPDAVGEGRELSKILVIDDDRLSAGLIDSCLRSAGFVSSYCCKPQEAIHTIEEELPDLIVMDVEMPEVDGFELCRRVREHPAMQFTPILFVTRKGDLAQRVRGLEVGGNDYIAKPFEPQELVARVRSHLERLAVLREMAIRDGLTRCFNHKFFKMRLDQEVLRARRYNFELAMAMIDVDFFKTVNDQHGHVVGDSTLAHLSGVISASVRSTDVVARYGGEEFAVLLAHAGIQEALIICERIRERVEQYAFFADSGMNVRIPVTVSIGIAAYTADVESAFSLIGDADKALYEAKQAGRNRVVLYAHELQKAPA